MFRDRAVVEQLGPFGYHAYDAWNYARSTWWRPDASDADMQDALEWFAERTPLRAAAGTSAFGVARGDNLIVVQVESLQDFAVDLDVGGRDVMPHLRRWSGDAVRFTNVTDETSEGRTSDAEFATMASLLPLDHGAAAFRHPGNHYVALPRVLREHGYATLSAVPFEPGFWNRRVTHPAYGFDRSLFESDFLFRHLKVALEQAPARNAPRVRIRPELVRERLSDDGTDRMGTERSRFPPADGAAPRAPAAAVRGVDDHAVAAPSVRRLSSPAQDASARSARGNVV